jgi:hypothetical protein
MCYEPRNGIVFENKAGKVIGYIEICFDCLRHEIEPPMRLGSFCSEKYNALRGIFIAAGINYGTLKLEYD